MLTHLRTFKGRYLFILQIRHGNKGPWITKVHGNGSPFTFTTIRQARETFQKHYPNGTINYRIRRVRMCYY